MTETLHFWLGAEIFDRSRLNDFIITFLFGKKSNQKKPPVSRHVLRVAQPVDEAAPNAAMRRYQSRSGAHNLAIAARLASIGALPASMMLAS
ncbi:MAG: hypothetical protein HF981_06610 [Desulfobacteraceae bacterium]|nr:hypothetical protein [Desulfobacteraceae bacterium]MBC2750041.1 hypothetical protein [Desulfobacteraceae bacterium]